MQNEFYYLPIPVSAIYILHKSLLNPLKQSSFIKYKGKNYRLRKNLDFIYDLDIIDKYSKLISRPQISIFDKLIITSYNNHLVINGRLTNIVTHIIDMHYLLFKTFDDKGDVFKHIYELTDVTKTIMKYYAKYKLFKLYPYPDPNYRGIRILKISAQTFLSIKYSKHLYRFHPSGLISSLKISI